MNIEESITQIDFEAISKAMKILNWTHIEDRPEGLDFYHPTALELKSTVRRLAEDLEPVMNETKWIESGGFRVSVTVYDDAPTLYRVNFTISNSSIIEKFST